MKIKDESPREDGSIDCMIEHPVYGWIPFTARTDDPDVRGKKLHTIVAAQVAGEATPDVRDDILQPPSDAELLRRRRSVAKADRLAIVRVLRDLGHWGQFKISLKLAGSEAEEDWELAGTISRMDPVFLPVFFNVGMTADEIDIVFGVRS